MAGLDYDVIVVGAGLAGLSAAQQLSLAGRRIIVLEASSRIGGRIAVDEIASTPVEIGSIRFRSEDDEMQRFLTSVGIQAIPCREFITTYQPDLTSNLRTGNFWLRKNLRRFMQHFEDKLNEIDLSKPWGHRGAAVLDQQSFQEVLLSMARGPRCRQIIKNYFSELIGYDLNSLSALDVLHRLNVSGFSFQSNPDNDALAIPPGAFHRLFGKLQFDLNIRLRHPVHEIEQFKNYVRVQGAFFSYTAKHVVLAMPMPCLRSMTFNPQVPQSKNDLWNKVFSVEVFRMVAVLDSADPKSIRNLKLAPFNSMEVIKLPEQQYLVVLEARGSAAIQLSRSKQSEREEVWKRSVGSSIKLPSDLQFSSKFWNDDFWHCGRHLFRPLGSLTSHTNVLSRPEGHIYFAGSETCLPHRGTLEGALVSGLRAANQILALSPAYHLSPSRS